MKIQTQFRLLICGILIVPLLLVAAQIIYQQFDPDRAAIAEYEGIAAELDNGMNYEEREFASHLFHRLSKMGGIAIFRKDFSVIHSTIPEFTVGDTASIEVIFTMMNREDARYSYSFESPAVWINGYILMQRDNMQPRKNIWGPMMYPIIAMFGLFLFLIIFAISMSLIIARSITRSVLVLEDATRRIAGGELDLAIDLKGSNEITSLTRSLNKMRNDLKEEERRRYRFIMGITHDLKTPLASIKGYAEAVADGVAEDAVSRAHALEIIAAKTDQLEGMINDLLDFVRMDSGEWRGQLKTVNIAAFLRGFAGGIVSDAELFHHRMEVTINLSEDAAAPMDERLVQRALENLVSNAIRYTPEGTLIRLEAALAGKAVALTVSDAGPGIAPEDLPHVFEIFYRGSASRREQGMGLGLAVVKWVADSHGWQVTAESEPGRGTLFTITIPQG